jgi:hypothetical protein
MRFCVGDEEFGAHNREVLAGWAAEWNAEADVAADALASELERVPRSRPPADALEQVRRERDELQAVLEPQEVSS